MRGFPKRNIIFARDDCTTLFIVDQDNNTIQHNILLKCSVVGDGPDCRNV